MKKILLTLSISLAATFTYAQRNIDWSVEEIITPTVINHAQNINMHIVCKNNGTADAFIGDTIYVRAALAGGQLISPWYFTILSKDMMPDDTVHVRATLPPVNITGASFNSSFIAQSLLQNRPGISLEGQTTLTNNSKSINIDYINDKGWGVNVNTVSADKTLSIYPNPASDILNIDVKMLGDNAEIKIIDATGKTVYSANGYNTESGFSVNVSDFSKGIYMVQVSNGSFISTSSIVIR